VKNNEQLRLSWETDGKCLQSKICYDIILQVQRRTKAASTYADDETGAGNGVSGEEAYGR